MLGESTLAAVQQGRATLQQAREAIEVALSDAERFGEVYTALRSWTWKALTGRRFDDELRGWHQIIRAVSARVRVTDDQLAERLRVLSELVYELVRFAEANPYSEVTQRTHVKSVINELLSSPNRGMRRDSLLKILGINQSNMSRVLSIMEGCGIIEREIVGRQVMIRLTRTDDPHPKPAFKSVDVGSRVAMYRPAVHKEATPKAAIYDEISALAKLWGNTGELDVGRPTVKVFGKQAEQYGANVSLPIVQLIQQGTTYDSTSFLGDDHLPSLVLQAETSRRAS